MSENINVETNGQGNVEMHEEIHANHRRKLTIGIDPGFDCLKIVIEGHQLKFPFNCVETEEFKFFNQNVSDNLYVYRDLDSKRTWRIGEYARQYAFSLIKTNAQFKDSFDSFYSKERFTKKEFKIAMETAIMLALIKYQSIDTSFSVNELDNIDLIIIVTLPHSLADEYRPIVIENLKGIHKFELQVGSNAFESYSFEIKDSNIGTISQTLASLMSVTTDDDGFEENNYDEVLNGPTITVDGGFYTVGILGMLDGTIPPEGTESNTEFAMQNVYEAIQETIKDKIDIQSYAMEYIFNKKDGKLSYMNVETEMAEIIDFNKLKEEKSSEICSKLINHLDKNFHYLLDTKYLVITGGTGATFYEQIKEYYCKRNVLDETHIILTQGKLNNIEWTPEFAIAVGAYKIGRQIAMA